jgi:Flp pilus assembly protein TadB
MAMLMCAVLVGVGLAYAVTGLLPKPVSPEKHAAPYAPSHRPASAEAGPDPGPLARAAMPLVPVLARAGLPRKERRRDLDLLERDVAVHLAQQAASALVLAAVGACLFALVRFEGLALPPVFLVVATVVPALYGFTAPAGRLKTEAAVRRDDLREITGGFLLLAALVLSGGGNLNEALATAYDAGDGPAAGQLRGALAYAESSGTSPWEALAELGRHADVPELEELAAAVSLSGHEGARLRATMFAKAKALRGRQLAALEAAAIAATEKAVLPTTLMMLGYLLLVLAPAAATALHAL